MTSSRKKVPKRTRYAYHEAGHAALNATLGDAPLSISLVEDGGSLGRVSYRRVGGKSAWWVQVDLAGFAAEEILTGHRPRRLFGIEFGLSVASVMHPSSPSQCVEGCDQYKAVHEIVGMGTAITREAIRAAFERYYGIAKESLSCVWPAVEAVAEALLAHDELDSAGCQKALRGAVVPGYDNIYSAVFSVQEAHGLLPKAHGYVISGSSQTA